MAKRKKLAEKRDSLEAFKSKLLALLEEETDRGAVLTGHAYLDDAVGEMLRGFFVDDERVAFELLQPSAPIGSFKVRVDLAYCLGLIGPNMKDDLDQIRRIRNAFAHRYEPLNFEVSTVSDRCMNLKVADLEDPEKAWPARVRFVRVVAILAAHFRNQIRKVERRKLGNDLKMFVTRISGSVIVGDRAARKKREDE